MSKTLKLRKFVAPDTRLTKVQFEHASLEDALVQLHAAGLNVARVEPREVKEGEEDDGGSKHIVTLLQKRKAAPPKPLNRPATPAPTEANGTAAPPAPKPLKGKTGGKGAPKPLRGGIGS